MTTTSAPIGATPVHSSSTTDTLLELNRAWRDAFNEGDLGRLMTMYEPDAVLVPGPGADPIQGHAAIAGSLQWFLSLGGRLDFVPRYWLVNGELALGSNAFEMTGGHDVQGDPVPLSGVTIEVARLASDGAWRYVVDHPFGGAS